MSTTGEGDAASTFSYEGGGGGAGGKFRERPFRRIEQRTPYDRPVNNLRGITATTPNENSGSWLTKLVMDPASNLISFGANRFSSVFSKRLPAPPRQEPGYAPFSMYIVTGKKIIFEWEFVGFIS